MNWQGMDELEIIEALAVYECLISCELELSESFDSMVEECCSSETKLQLMDDAPMLSEEFTNFADSLVRDGQLHPLQYANYCYVGEIG